MRLSRENSEVLIVLLALLPVLGILLSFPATGEVSQPFTQLAMVGEDGRIGRYQSKVPEGEELRLFIYLLNREGKTLHYSVLVKAGNDTIPVSPKRHLESPQIARFDRSLNNGQNITIPVSLLLKETGSSRRLVFELWYDKEGVLSYSGKFLQLWIDVVGPS